MPMTHTNTRQLTPAAAYAATISSGLQKPIVGLRFDEVNAPAGRRYR
jgi:hypothetical protein